MKIQAFEDAVNLDYSLLSHNTFGIDVHAARFVEYHSEEELLECIRKGLITALYLHIGQGSNLLFTKDFPGTVLHSCIQGIEVVGVDGQRVLVRVGAGVVWDDFVAYCVEQGWYGVENLSAIPGEVGAAAVQNIGAYGVEAGNVIEAVETIDITGCKKTYTNLECCYGYRDSVFKRPEMKSVFVTYVCFSLATTPCFTLDYGTVRKELEKYPVVDLAAVRKVIVGIRREKLPDPAVLGNAGSFFKNPVILRKQFEALLLEYPDMPHYEWDEKHVKVPAGWLIEQCGWKGKSLGHAAVHCRQALVLVNAGGATGREIVALAQAIQSAVYNKFQIKIVPEVNIL